MRRILLSLAMAACIVPPALAQSRDAADDAAPATKADAERVPAAQRSALGQVMSMLTGLLQEAAAREAGTAPAALSSDQSAVTVTVTPAAGRSSLRRGGAIAPPASAPPAVAAGGEVASRGAPVPD